MKTKITSAFLLAGMCLTGGASADNALQLEAAQQNVVAMKQQYELEPSPGTLANYQAAQDRLAKVRLSITANLESSKAAVSESEPNGTAATANPLAVGDSGNGDLAPAGDRDFWEVAGVGVGDVVYVLLDSEVSGTGSDTEMSVFENDGSTLIEFDDDSGDGLGSAVVATVPTAGSVFFELNEFGDNGTIEPYNVFQFVSDGSGQVAESEPNDSAATADTLGAPSTGDLGDATDDFYTVFANSGDRIAVIANNDPDGNAAFADASLTILDTDGATTLAAEAPFTVTGQNAAAATAVNTGVHYIQVANGGSGAETNYAVIAFVNDETVPVELLQYSVD